MLLPVNSFVWIAVWIVLGAYRCFSRRVTPGPCTWMFYSCNSSHVTGDFTYTVPHKHIVLFRFEAQVVDLEDELRSTLAGLIKAERAVKEGTAVQTSLVID